MSIFLIHFVWVDEIMEKKTENPKKHAPKQQLGDQLAALMKACADQTRLRLLYLLAREDEICVCDLVRVLETNQPKVSRHLAYLKKAGLVSTRKDGLWVYYRLASPLAHHAKRLIDCLTSCCSESPEMRRDADALHEIQGAQPLVSLTKRNRPT